MGFRKVDEKLEKVRTCDIKWKKNNEILKQKDFPGKGKLFIINYLSKLKLGIQNFELKKLHDWRLKDDFSVKYSCQVSYLKYLGIRNYF